MQEGPISIPVLQLLNIYTTETWQKQIKVHKADACLN